MSIRIKLLTVLTALGVALTWGIGSAPSEAAVTGEIVMAGQTFTVGAVQAPTAARDQFTVTLYTVVQWPTADHDVTSDGDFGPRSCRGCSYFHEGADFNPGGGAPVQVVADGYVVRAGWDGGLGEAVYVQHTINGQPVTTIYGHMQSGSLQVYQGQQIEHGTVLGLVGDTGSSTGNHLHFQVEIGGTPIDPMPWLTANVNWPVR